MEDDYCKFINEFWCDIEERERKKAKKKGKKKEKSFLQIYK
jgi:hypothetical protein